MDFFSLKVLKTFSTKSLKKTIFEKKFGNVDGQRKKKGSPAQWDTFIWSPRHCVPLNILERSVFNAF